jgi:hypothetical protein
LAREYTFTETPSTLWISTPAEKAYPPNLKTRRGGHRMVGFRERRSTAIQTAAGTCVPTP